MGNRYVKFQKEGPSPQSPEETPFKIVVAIDFGTYASGYAYQRITDFENNRQIIYAPQKFKSLTGYKEPSSLLLKPDKSFDSSGSRARKIYYKFKTQTYEKKPENWQKYLYFENFKMMLYHREENLIRDDLPFEAENGESVPAIDVFTMTIGHLKNEMIDHFKASGLDSSHIKWVITVPAIWGDPAKQLMLRAAIKTGISKKCLVLALEPECAAIHCSQLPRDSLDIHGESGRIERVIEPGATIMVVDIGGGTVDVSIMMIRYDGTMGHIHKSGGNGLGGVRINNKIIQELTCIFGEDAMYEFRKTCGVDDLEIRDDIERAKCTWRERNWDPVNDKFNIKFPSRLKSIWMKYNANKDFNEHLREHKVTRDRGYLSLEQEKVDPLFDESVESIVEYLENVMRECTGHTINALITVGGFAKSDYLVSCLRERLHDKGIPVIRPADPELSVIKGAVLYGQDESIISSRVMRHTYGVAMTMKFDNNRHEESERYTDSNNVEMANNVFRKHVEVGEKISVRKWIHGKDYYPDAENERLRVFIFQSEKQNPTHTTEEDCECIGHVDVDFPSQDDIKDRVVRIEFYFAGTSINVRAITDPNGCPQMKTLDIVL